MKFSWGIGRWRLLSAWQKRLAKQSRQVAVGEIGQGAEANMNSVEVGRRGVEVAIAA